MIHVNKAEQGLEDLLALEAHTTDASDNLQKLQENTRSPGIAAYPGEKAGFSLPEGVATAVGASLVLGPAGILLGVAQGILGKQAKQNALDAWAADNDAMSAANQVINDDYDRLEMILTDPLDADQLATVRAMHDASVEMIKSPNPETSARGVALAEQASAGKLELVTRQEEQSIEQGVRDKQAARDLTNTQQGIQQHLLSAYDAQSANFKTVTEKTNSGRALVARGNPVDLIAALIQINKALDPIGVVRPEEAKAFGNVGNKIEQMQTKLEEWAGTGQSMRVPQRAEIIELLDTIDSFNRGIQSNTDLIFQGRAIDAELPEKYVNDFSAEIQYPSIPAGPLQERKAPGDDASDALSMLIGDAVDAAGGGVDNAVEGVVNALGLPDYTPTSPEEQAKTNPRVRRALRTN